MANFAALKNGVDKPDTIKERSAVLEALAYNAGELDEALHKVKTILETKEDKV